MMSARPMTVASILVVGLTVVGAAIARSDVGPRFGPPRTVVTASGVGGMTEQEVGDLNGDGRADLVVTRIAFPIARQTFPIGVFLGDGRGGYTDGSAMFAGPIPRTEHARQILIADFNGDRRNDLFIADHGYDGEPFPGHPNTLVLSTPDGKLVDASANIPSESGFSHSAATADVDRDGDLDVYVGNLCCAPRVSPEILVNDGVGRFERADGILPPAVTDPSHRNRFTRALFLDANLDGAPDLVLGADNTTVSSVVLLNDGTGRFPHISSYLPAKALGPTSITISLATIDVDRDAKPDLLVGFQHEDFSGRRMQVLIGNGDGTFRDETAERLPEQSDGPSWPYAIRLADVDGDGRSDFGVALSLGPGGEAPALYLDDGTGRFRMSMLGATGPVFSFVDADGDGHVDVVSSTPGSVERHAVQLQLVTPAPPGALRAAPGAASGIRLVWAPSRGASAYEVFRAGGRTSKRLVSTVAAPRYTDRLARSGVTYRYWVRAVNGAGRSPLVGPVRGRR